MLLQVVEIEIDRPATGSAAKTVSQSSLSFLALIALTVKLCAATA